MTIGKLIIVFVAIFTLLGVKHSLAQEFPPADQIPSATGMISPGSNSRIQQRRSQIQQRLQSLQNQNKANRALNIFDRLNAINIKKTTQLQQALDRMEIILQSLLNKTEAANSTGIDVTNAQSAGVEALTALNTAKEAVASQAGKVYGFDGSAEANLKLNVGRQISLLQSDLQVLKKLVNDAKHNLVKLIRELAKTGVGRIGQKDKSATAEPALFQPLIQP